MYVRESFTIYKKNSYIIYEYLSYISGMNFFKISNRKSFTVIELLFLYYFFFSARPLFLNFGAYLIKLLRTNDCFKEK